MDAKSCQRGQALVEFIIFLPFMLMMYTVVVVLGDAINGSINQQKATRGYFYHRNQNSAQVVRPRIGTNSNFTTWKSFGHHFVGWSDYIVEPSPYLPCYRLNLPFAADTGDACDRPYTKTTTQFIRVGTIYGICGATFQQDPSGGLSYGETPIGAAAAGLGLDIVTGATGCQIQR